MLTKKQINEVREHLQKAQNPLFLFDNDQDGLCSFLLLRRYLGRGKGFPVKNARINGKDYVRKINEFNSDYIFILDVPEFSEDFFVEVEKYNIPLVWIDHHGLAKEKIPNFVYYYNPMMNRKKTNEPVTFLCYEITKRKEDMWLGVIGCISDYYVPKFYTIYKKENPELCINLKSNKEGAFDILYGSEIGRVARMFGFAIKDTTTNVINMMKFLIKSKNPYDVLNENKENRIIHSRFLEVEKKYSNLIHKAKQKVIPSSKFVFFKYGGDTSMSAEISNGLKYIYPDKYIFVAYSKDARVNISSRGKNVKEKIMKIISQLDSATGGGHEDAVGAQIKRSDLGKFEMLIKKEFD